MAKLTVDQVRHIAQLARLKLTDAEEKRFLKELNDILKYVEKLQEVNTDNVQATAQITGLHNVFRTDEREEKQIQPDDILTCSPLPIVEHQIQTPSALG